MFCIRVSGANYLSSEIHKCWDSNVDIVKMTKVFTGKCTILSTDAVVLDNNHGRQQ